MTTASREPLLTIRPGANPLRQYARDMWRHRDLAGVLATRDVKLRYRQTFLGAAWVVLQPLLGAGILSFVFNRVAQLPTEGVPAFVFTFAGMMVWTAFSSTFTRSTGSLVAGGALVSKIFFPRLILPIATVYAALVDFAVSSLILIYLLVTERVFGGWRLVTLPVWFGLLLMLALGGGFLLAGVAVRYRDINQIVPVAVQLLLYLSPVAYSASAIPDRYDTLFHLNPVAALIQQFRWSVLGTEPAATGFVVYSAALAFVLFFTGAFVLSRFERKLADVI